MAGFHSRQVDPQGIHSATLRHGLPGPPKSRCPAFSDPIAPPFREVNPGKKGTSKDCLRNSPISAWSPSSPMKLFRRKYLRNAVPNDTATPPIRKSRMLGMMSRKNRQSHQWSSNGGQRLHPFGDLFGDIAQAVEDQGHSGKGIAQVILGDPHLEQPRCIQ